MAKHSSATGSSRHSFYDVLKIKPGALSNEDVRAAYIKLAKIYHPDQNPKNKDLAEKRFARVTEAYEALNTAQKRRAYDLSLQSLNRDGISNDNAHKDGLWNSFTAFFTSSKSKTKIKN